MNKNLQKIAFTIALALFVIPQVTFAAWWNPLSWGIFSSIFHTNPKVEVTNTIQLDQATTSDSATTVKIDVPTSTPPVTKPAIKPSQKVVPPTTPSVPVQVPQQPKPTGTLCNGTYWDSCPSGQNFVCPATGKAYCEAPQQPVQAIQQKDNYQICRDTYGHATWDGSSYASDGGPSCSCNTGYEASTDGKSCVLNQTQVVQPVVPQQDFSINSTACDKATKNLQNFQKSYTNNYAALSSTIAANNIVQARLQIFANQYNTALPGYQMAAQAACKIPASNNQCQATLQKFDAFQAQNTLSPNNTSGSSQTLGNRQAMELGNYETEIYYSCQ